MAQYRKKPVIIEAEQWFPGKQVGGVTEKPSEIIYSLDGKHYYVSAYGLVSSHWLGVEKLPGSLSEQQKRGSGIFEPAWLEIRKKGEEPYHRIVYPFATFDIKSGAAEPVISCRDNDLWPDYASVHGWPEQAPISVGLVATLEGPIFALPGDWIITGVRGEKYPCKPDIFEETYELA